MGRFTIISGHVAALGCLLASALVAPAALAQGARWYGGASVGRSAVAFDDARITAGLAAQGLRTDSIAHRDRDTALRVFGGLQIHRNVGLEAGWLDMGRMGSTATTTPAGTLAGDVRFKGLNLDVVGMLPMSDRLSLLARFGGASIRTRGTFITTGAVGSPSGGSSTSARHFGARYGVGLAWRLTDAWELRLEGERIRVDDRAGNRGHVDLLNLGVVYYFGGTAAAARAGRRRRPARCRTRAPLAPVHTAAAGVPLLHNEEEPS